jgi:hypothetical protein
VSLTTTAGDTWKINRDALAILKSGRVNLEEGRTNNPSYLKTGGTAKNEHRRVSEFDGNDRRLAARKSLRVRDFDERQ